MWKLIAVACAAIVFFSGTNTSYGQAKDSQSGQVGSVDDLKQNNTEQLKIIKDTLQETNQTVERMANQNMAGALNKFNRSLIRSTKDIKNATGEYEKAYSPEAQKKLLDTLSTIYRDIINEFQTIDVSFLENAKDTYGNAIMKGSKIARDNLRRSTDGEAYKKKLITAKVQSLKSLSQKVKSKNITKKELADFKRIVRDVKRLEKLIARDKLSKTRWARIEAKFKAVEQRKMVQLDSLETSILAFNQLRDDITGQKEAIDQMIILGQLDELTTEEFESSVDGLMEVGDNLFQATDAAFENVFAGLLTEDTAVSQETGQADASELNDVSSAAQDLLKKYQ